MEFTSKEKSDMPAYNYGHITEITPEEIRGMGAKAVAVDIDNTSALFGSYTLEDGVREWADSMREAGIPVIIVSNTVGSRAYVIAKKMGGVPFVAFACKPLTAGLRIASSRLGVPVEKIAMIGDKISTDIRSANKAGAIPVKVEPLSTDNSLLVGVAKYVSVAAVAAITLVKLR